MPVPGFWGGANVEVVASLQDPHAARSHEDASAFGHGLGHENA